MKEYNIGDLEILSEKLKAQTDNYPPHLKDGLMGVALFFYFIYQKTDKKVYQEYADTLLDSVTNSITSNSPLDFGQGLSGIGWSIEYLVQRGLVSEDADMLLADFDVIFRRRLIARDFGIHVLVGVGIYLAERIQAKRSKPSCMKMRRIKRDALLWLNRMEDRWEIVMVHEEWLMLQCLSVLIEFYQFGVCRFKEIQLIDRALITLWENREKMSKSHRIYSIRLLNKINSCIYANDVLEKRLDELSIFFQQSVGVKNENIASNDCSSIVLFDEQVSLITENQHCISLATCSLFFQND